MISRPDQARREVNTVAVRLLSRRGLSVSELRLRLHAKGYDHEIVEECICGLVQRGYLNDAALCAALVDKHLRQGKCGRQSVWQKLRQRGLDETVVSAALQNWPVEEEWQQAAALLQKRFGRTNDAGEWKKWARFLSYRGYAPGTIRKAVEFFTKTLSDAGDSPEI